VKFVLTHPMHTHPYRPELVAGDGVAQVAQAAERAGFYGFGFTDHPAPTQRWLDWGGHDALEPFVAMAYAAAVTSTLRFIPNLIVLPYRNPLLVAKAGATLDVLSAGRFTLAVGVGYLRGEFGALGVDYEERAAIVDEALRVIRLIWTGDDVSFTGRHFELSGIAARRRVVAYGDGWCPFAAPGMLAKVTKTATMDAGAGLVAGIDDLRRRCDAAGRDFSSIDITFNGLPGTPGTPTFNADDYLTEVERLAALGVTAIQLSAPGDGLAHAVQAIEEFGETVIRHDREEVTS
jgi:alkanesulfonate monooxygenase SsuD/methylene tetrahydromethanopterin reductase-like flavin-dependent oxidoreductase (luciferase family)